VFTEAKDHGSGGDKIKWIPLCGEEYDISLHLLARRRALLINEVGSLEDVSQLQAN